MGEKTDQIELYIAEQRVELGDNINDLRQKVKDTFDWRVQFERNPMAMVAVAVGGGLLLSALVGGRSRSRRVPPERWHSEDLNSAGRRIAGKSRDFAPMEEPQSELWGNVKGALVGVAAAKVEEFVDAVMPGFSREFKKVSSRAT